MNTIVPLSTRGPSSPEGSITASTTSTTPSSSPPSSSKSAPSSAGFLSPPASPQPEKHAASGIMGSSTVSTSTTTARTSSRTATKSNLISGTVLDGLNDNLHRLVTPALSPTSSDRNNDENVHEIDHEIDISLPTPVSSTGDHFKLFASSYDLLSLDAVAKRTTSHLTRVLGTNHHTPTMIPTCMTCLPSGKEIGTFLSVDLGGSTFRVAFVCLKGPGKQSEIVYMSVVPVPDSVKQGSGNDFFLWMAHEVKKGVDKVLPNQPKSVPINMGISWSFPFVQTAMHTAIIEKMGKGYNVADEISGWNLGKSFENAFEKLDLNIKVTAIVNDGGACMISRAYADNATKISLILGTGINAGIMVPSHLIGEAKLESIASGKPAPTYMINTEISMLDDTIVPASIWDVELDAAIERPGFQPLETKVSGRYLGEISRLIIRDLVLNNTLCGGILPEKLDVPYSLESSLMSDIEEHFRNSRLDLARDAFLRAHPHPYLSDSDLDQICDVFVNVSNRSAAFTAAVLVGLADIIYQNTAHSSAESQSCIISYTGTVIEKYPLFRKRCQQFLDSLCASRGIQLRLESSENGSIFGPVIAAAMNHCN
ncbi:hexokinase 2 [Sugiyamaella lignohabitans]|uniref:Phosphotransferase n=1 Tax=Sugiyamaella lignohabitans TaxID=796027 RepID=A0A167C4Y3_9ASCO|nr:hexokinase 2 [Sugiyamaella lignohabitans]ANB11222.1 hexokinase 2 [Sugiyamaella lignohabitans]